MQIVLLAQLVEDSIVKCEQYWFDDYIPHKFGELTVTLVKVMPYANFVVRTFELSREDITGDARLVCQYHFLAWPEHGVPGDPLSLLEFHMKVRSRISNCVTSDNCPLLVHCGTGVSRTGVFIAVDYSLMRAKEENCVNVYRYITHFYIIITITQLVKRRILIAVWNRRHRWSSSVVTSQILATICCACSVNLFNG